MRAGLNVNTLFSAVILAVSGWTLREVVSIGQVQAANAARTETNVRDIADLRLKISSLELRQQELQIQIVRLQRGQ